MNILLKFNDSDDVVKIIYSGGNVKEFLNTPSLECPLIGSEIKLVQPPLGEGAEGIVFEIKFKNGSGNNFVVKEATTVPVDIIEPDRHPLELTYREWLEYGIDLFSVKGSYDINFIAEFNKVPKNKLNEKVKIGSGIVFSFPILPRSTLTENCKGTVKKYRNFKKGSYVCDPSIVSTLMSALTSVVFIEDRICPHFVQHISFVSCELLKSYTFMERIDFDLNFYLTEKVKDSKSFKLKFQTILFQVLVALSHMQEYPYRGTPLKITHNDLHPGNIFLGKSERIIWKNEELSKTKWWKYTINKVDFYIPSRKYMIKFGDWGYSAKHSNPRIHRQDCLFKDTSRNINISPVRYLKSLDIFYFISTIMGKFLHFVSPSKREIMLEETLNLLSYMGPDALEIFNAVIDNSSGRIYSGELGFYEEDLISCRELLLTDYFLNFRGDKIKDKEDHIEVSILNI